MEQDGVTMCDRDGRLAGRTALITGAARRVGQALAVTLADVGARVVIHHHRSRQEAHDVAADIVLRGGRAFIVDGDLADPAVASALPARAAAIAGAPLDILVNNASIFDQGSVATTSSEAWDANQAVNLRAPFLLAQAFVRQLAADRMPARPADIINLNDIRALRPGADHFAYTISKVGLHGLTRSLALALAPRVRVNELALGSILPPDKAPDGYVHTRRDEIPLRRFATLAQVGRALLYLLDDPGATGQTICVDGGCHLA